MENGAQDNATEPEALLAGPKRQHVLPRFYLEGFSKSGLLAVYDRHVDQVRLQTPENTGVIGHFYTVEDKEGRKRYEIEAMLADAENKASPVINRLAAGEDVAPNERGDLATFLALAMFRTPDLVDSIKSTMGHLVKRVAETAFANVERATASLHEWPGAPEFDSELELEEQAKTLVDFTRQGHYAVSIDHQYAVGTSLRLAFVVAPILAGRTWHVLHSNAEAKSFITSDAPLVLTAREPWINSAYGVGFGSPDAMVLFPLSQASALIIVDNGESLRHSVVERDRIRNFNLMIAERCQRYLIARDEALVRSLADNLRLADRAWRPKFSFG